MKEQELSCSFIFLEEKMKLYIDGDFIAEGTFE